MALTDVKICSDALLLIGEGAIDSFDDEGDPAVVSAALYTGILENLLTKHRWRFATGKIQLSRLVAAPENDWTYAFQLPSDYLTMDRVHPRSLYEIFEDKLYSDQTELEIDYRFKPDESRFPPYFVMTLQYFLAAQFSLTVAEDRVLMKEYMALAKDELITAKSTDSQAYPNTYIRSSPFTSVRNI